MKSVRGTQNSYKLKSAISSFIGKYKWIIISMLIIAMLGIVVGVFTASKYSNSIDISNIPDSNFIKFLSREKSSFGLFLNYFISYSLVILAIIFVNNSVILNIINYIYIFILGYKLGFVVAALIMLYSFAGIVNSIVVILPFQLVVLMVLILISSIAIHRYYIYHKFGCNTSNTNYAKLYLVLYLLFVVVLFIMCMVMPIIHITIIVN